jgi:hypothetical protein
MNKVRGDIVIVTLPGKMINQYIYFKNYVYSLDTKKLVEPTEKSHSGKYCKDFYCLHPGKYLIIEVDIDIENNIIYKYMTVFTKEEYLSNKRKQFPGVNIDKFKKIYQSCGSEIVEWIGDIPNEIKLPRECIPEIKEEYKQPQEVEDKLSPLLKEDGGKKPIIQYLLKKYNAR